MTELYATGRLDDFGKVFPIDDFKKHLSNRLAYINAQRKLGMSLFDEVFQRMREKGVKIPIGTYLLTPYYFVKEFARKHLRTVRWVRKIYRDLNLQRVVHRHWKFNISDYDNDLEINK